MSFDGKLKIFKKQQFVHQYEAPFLFVNTEKRKLFWCYEKTPFVKNKVGDLIDLLFQEFIRMEASTGVEIFFAPRNSFPFIHVRKWESVVRRFPILKNF
jgi:hypothetical protein